MYLGHNLCPAPRATHICSSDPLVLQLWSEPSRGSPEGRTKGRHAAGGYLGCPRAADSSSNCGQVSKWRLQPGLQWEGGGSLNYFSYNPILGLGLHKNKKSYIRVHGLSN